VRRFGYVFDPLFLICCSLYAANRWLIKPHSHIVFFHSWFNDLWLIPCALPPVLLVQRWLGLRIHDEPPTAGEIAAHLVGWSILFEVIGPHIMRTVGDPWDAVAYTFGAVVGFICWRVLKFTDLGWDPGFDFLAPFYRRMEWVLAGKKLQRCRTAFLLPAPTPRRALLIGEGHGRFLAPLLKMHPGVHCICVDASKRMLDVTRARLVELGLDTRNVEFVQADLAEWTPPRNSFDLIVTHFVLDCFTERQLELIVARLANAATAEARWLAADFRKPKKGLARWRAQAILAVMYIFFRWATGIAAERLPAIDSLMGRQGFVLRERRIFEWGLLQSDLWARELALLA
jgi:ubiquinone/menaquinone biosynthesis C-methylase UbiE